MINGSRPEGRPEVSRWQKPPVIRYKTTEAPAGGAGKPIRYVFDTPEFALSHCFRNQKSRAHDPTRMPRGSACISWRNNPRGQWNCRERRWRLRSCASTDCLIERPCRGLELFIPRDHRWFALPANIQHPFGIGFCGKRNSNRIVTFVQGKTRHELHQLPRIAGGASSCEPAHVPREHRRASPSLLVSIRVHS